MLQSKLLLVANRRENYHKETIIYLSSKYIPGWTLNDLFTRKT